MSFFFCFLAAKQKQLYHSIALENLNLMAVVASLSDLNYVSYYVICNLIFKNYLQPIQN